MHQPDATPIIPPLKQAADDFLTVTAIGLLAAIIASILHEGFGHAATALLTGAPSGLLTTVSWSSTRESRLVSAAGTLANLAAALLFWLALRTATRLSARWRFLLFLCLAFNLFDGTGYFFFSGVTNFGDWAAVISGWPSHGLWRLFLIVVGMASYFVAVLIVGSALVRYVGVPRNDSRRLNALTFIPTSPRLFFLVQVHSPIPLAFA